MRDGLRSKGTKIPEVELQRIMENADVNGDGKVDYEEFLAATMHLGKLEREETLYKAFQVQDTTADQLVFWLMLVVQLPCCKLLLYFCTCS